MLGLKRRSWEGCHFYTYDAFEICAWGMNNFGSLSVQVQHASQQRTVRWWLIWALWRNTGERWMLHKQFSENSLKKTRLRQCSKKLIHCSARSFFPLWRKNQNSYMVVFKDIYFRWQCHFYSMLTSVCKSYRCILLTYWRKNSIKTKCFRKQVAPYFNF